MTPRKKATKTAAPEDEARYADLVEELERILEDLENDEIDVDELAERVKRGSELIRICRERLVASRAQIEDVVADLESFDTDEDAGDATDPDDA